MKYLWILSTLCLLLMTDAFAIVVHDTESIDLHRYPTMVANEDQVWMCMAYWTQNELAGDTDFTDILFTMPRDTDRVRIESYNNSKISWKPGLEPFPNIIVPRCTLMYVQDQYGYIGSFKVLSIKFFDETNVRTARVTIERWTDPASHSKTGTEIYQPQLAKKQDRANNFYYDITGKIIPGKPTRAGIYIYNNRKVIVVR